MFALSDDQAQTQAEYALILVGVALIAAGAVALVGTPLSQLYQAVTDALG